MEVSWFQDHIDTESIMEVSWLLDHIDTRIHSIMEGEDDPLLKPNA